MRLYDHILRFSSKAVAKVLLFFDMCKFLQYFLHFFRKKVILPLPNSSFLSHKGTISNLFGDNQIVAFLSHKGTISNLFGDNQIVAFLAFLEN